MDKIELSSQDIVDLLAWRDDNVELVRTLPAPLKAIEIDCKDSGFRINGIRTRNSLKLCVSKGFEGLGSAEFDIRPGNVLVKKRGRYKFDESSFQSVLTVYCSLMALMVYSTKKVSADCLDKNSARHKDVKKTTKKLSKRVTYILQNVNGRLTSVPNCYHASPSGIFTVRGHYRHYKNGKVIWIDQFKKGTGKNKSKTYRMGGK